MVVVATPPPAGLEWLGSTQRVKWDRFAECVLPALTRNLQIKDWTALWDGCSSLPVIGVWMAFFRTEAKNKSGEKEDVGALYTKMMKKKIRGAKQNEVHCGISVRAQISLVPVGDAASILCE